MKYSRLTRKQFILPSIAVVVVIISLIGGFWIINRGKDQGTKPNISPGSGKTASPASQQAEAKKLSQTKELNKMLAEAPKDPRSQCLVVSRFNSEQTRNDMLDIENKRHDSAVQKYGSNNAENYIHKQNLAKIQKQFEQSNNINNCK